MLATLNKRSVDHLNCEDNFTVLETDNIIQGVIADGCSTGIKSNFASQLYCYFIQQYINLKLNILENNNLQFLVNDIYDTADNISLEVNQLLSTLILFTYYKDTKVLNIRVFGDGYYYVNGKEFVIEQNNEPDYIAYHLDNIQPYLDKYPVQTYLDVNSFTISSDGISSFKLPQSKSSDINPKELLLSSNSSSNHLDRKFNIISRQGWYINDDLTLISYHL